MTCLRKTRMQRKIVGVRDLTFDAFEADFEVGLQIIRARLVFGEFCIRHSDLAFPATRTACVSSRRDVSRAADVSVIQPDAPANPHSAVTRMRDQYHVIGIACRVEGLRLAEGGKVVEGI